MRLIDADVLYKKTVELEARARNIVEVAMRDDDKMKWHVWSAVLTERSAFKFDIADAPTIELSGQKKGQWIRNDNGTYSCSVCQSWIPKEQHHYARYCLYCGANMRQPIDIWEG